MSSSHAWYCLPLVKKQKTTGLPFFCSIINYNDITKTSFSNCLICNFKILSTDPRIQNFIMILIITNSIVLGVQAGEYYILEPFW